MAQPGRALAWGARGRQFKSARPDHLLYSNQSFSSDIRGRPTKHPNLSSAAADDTNRDCEGCEAKPSPSAVQICPSRPITFSNQSFMQRVFVADPRSTPTCHPPQRMTPIETARGARQSRALRQFKSARPDHFRFTQITLHPAKVIRGRPTKHPNLSSAAADDTNRDCEGCEAKPSPSAVQICPSRPITFSNQSFSSDIRGRPTKHPNLSSAAADDTNRDCEGCEAKPSPSAVQICPSRPITFSNQSFSSDIRGRPTKHPNLSSAAADDTNRDCEGCEAKPSPSAVRICPSRPSLKSISYGMLTPSLIS